MKNQDKMQATYNAKHPIEILFNKIYTRQEFRIAGNYPFSDQELANMVLSKILATQEYTHAYHMWKSITSNERTCVFQGTFPKCITRQGGNKANIRSGRL